MWIQYFTIHYRRNEGLLVSFELNQEIPGQESIKDRQSEVSTEVGFGPRHYRPCLNHYHRH